MIKQTETGRQIEAGLVHLLTSPVIGRCLFGDKIQIQTYSVWAGRHIAPWGTPHQQLVAVEARRVPCIVRGGGRDRGWGMRQRTGAVLTSSWLRSKRAVCQVSSLYAFSDEMTASPLPQSNAYTICRQGRGRWRSKGGQMVRC